MGSLNFGVTGSESMDSTPLIHNNESCSTHSATDQCSRTRTTKCSSSSEESDSTSSHLVFDSVKNYSELNNHHVADSERIWDGHAKPLDCYIGGKGETLADHPKEEKADLQKDIGVIVQYCDALACDKESVCSSSEELRYGVNGEPSDLSAESYSGLTPTNNTGGKLPMVSEHPVNNIDPNMSGMTNDSMYRELNPEVSKRNLMVPSEMLKFSLPLL